jgi:hypothetical protein
MAFGDSKDLFRPEYGRLWRPWAETNSLGNCGGAVGFRASCRSILSGAVRVPRRSHYVYTFIIHGAGWLMASLFLLFAFFFGLTVMQISPAELGAIDVATAIGGLAAFAICALLLFQIVLTLRKLSRP